MSGAASDPNERFVERDDKATELGYGDGGTPLYIGILWVAFIIAYIAVMVWLALPDLRAWSAL